ncbi:DegT/DnrJ/EryC1/StrS family aminotransferase [Campylobacter troglodytis]|uniref:DegT/DnrJ/EryC1/StrS family aminotransferase n=1 Tax=Campylobacter troglodytis TaxID=654363 RepID=UPI00115A703F|nr:DegT/DnrJ/EryC1/StrS family aminotransferase [Campylobacter troglodytis]TQR61214.1 aminotransferase DegT [Campylobacter troglodytis]
MRFAFVDLKAQYQAYKEEIDSEISKVLESASFIGGAKLDEFEENLARYVGVKHAIGCSSGTSSLILALMALGIGEGDEVIVPSFTFIATAEMVSLLKARPVFADINLIDYNLDLASVESLVTPRTKAIIAVSIFGQMPDLWALNEFCKGKNIALIEDGAQSFGATQLINEASNGVTTQKEGNFKKSCSIAKLSCTSFFPSKPLGAYGDAGAVFTNDDELAKKIRIYLNHGQTSRYKHQFIGINGRLDSIQAAILDVKLRHLDDELAQRKRVAKIYDEGLKNAILPQVKKNFTSVYAQYSVRVENRDKLVKRLSAQGIPSAIHYPLGLHLQAAFSSLGYKLGDLPNTELVSEQILSLPMSAFLRQEDQAEVIRAFE